ncbi:hypothetical protein X962_2005 [Burkholderia pseudomallei MSHR7343]|uniref:hypothetical protein n=1 Tax=Burkholderia pseudomallei TaxID=28450 RepID=UPI000531C8EC|nr:hypothetical protein [Burkholderia pseudomallei]KGS34527.1 hypothetical protein X962_2005 [Burkholderia pseudomallei MSHR7343]
MNDQQQSRADALTRIGQFLTDVVTAAGLLSHGHTDKKLATRITDQAYELRKHMYFLAASPVEQPALLTAQDALAAIETFEIVGDNNDSREPNAEDRFILTEFVAHLFGGFRVELSAAAPASANETGAKGAQSWTDGYRAALNVVASDVRDLFVNYVHCKGADGLLERCKKLHEQIAAEADRLLARSRDEDGEPDV